MNLHRRHLDARAARLQVGERQVGKFANVLTQEDAAKLLAVGERPVRYARVVTKDGVPEVVKLVDDGKLAILTGAAVSKAEPEKVGRKRRRRASAGGFGGLVYPGTVAGQSETSRR